VPRRTGAVNPVVNLVANPAVNPVVNWVLFLSLMAYISYTPPPPQLLTQSIKPLPKLPSWELEPPEPELDLE